MLFNRRVISALIGIGMASALHSGAAQSDEKFKTRLAPVAIDATMRATVSGTGSVAATLAGSKLSVTGTFEGLLSPATAAHIHLSRVAGIRGPAVLDLTVSRAVSGSISGTFDLTPEQVESLKKGKFYVQIDSEKAPEGNLWGWLMR
jgi:CHRD domain